MLLATIAFLSWFIFAFWATINRRPMLLIIALAGASLTANSIALVTGVFEKKEVGPEAKP